MTGEVPFDHIHCGRCGRAMAPGGLCVRCGWDPVSVALGLSGGARHPPTEPAPAEPATRSGDRHRSGATGRPAPSTHREPPRPAPSPTPVRPEAPPSAPMPSPDAPAGVREPPARTAPPPAAAATPPARRPFRPIDLWRRYLPPVRLVWIFLLAIAGLQGAFASASQAGPIVAVLVLGAITDLGFQRIRFPKLRVPDAALATSLFVALIIWPTSLDVPMAAVAMAAVGLRHLLRVASHPLVNPAALGLVVATVVFGLPTSWHVGLTPVDAAVVAVLGAVLIVRAPHTYRLAVGYFASYLPITAGLLLALGGRSHFEPVFVAGALGPASIFLGMFMATEPRTAPTARPTMWVFAAVVGGLAAVLPVVFGEVAALSALGAIAPFLALFGGNFLTVLLPAARGIRAAPGPAARPVRVPVAARTRLDPGD